MGPPRMTLKVSPVYNDSTPLVGLNCDSCKFQPLPKPLSAALSGLKFSCSGTTGPHRLLAFNSGSEMAQVYCPVRGSTWLRMKLMKLKALECTEVDVDMTHILKKFSNECDPQRTALLINCRRYEPMIFSLFRLVPSKPIRTLCLLP
ncbi:hypothetical protein EMIT0P258_40149 [Pseudomonas sp. IT-P258]